MNYNEFEEKIKTMSAHDIIMSMVNGLRAPKAKVDMRTFGGMRDGICFGCAATNAILNIMDANEEEAKSHVIYRQKYDNSSSLRHFEYAIDTLRMGSPNGYNEYAYAHGIAQITPIPGQELPSLGDDYTEEQLQEYEKLAKYQLTIKTNNNDRKQENATSCSGADSEEGRNLKGNNMSIYELISYAAGRVGVAEEELLTSRSYDLSRFRAAIVHHLRSNGWRECSVSRALGVGQPRVNHIMTRYALDRGYRDMLQRYAKILDLSGIYVPSPAPKSKDVIINPVHGELVLTAVSKHMGVPVKCILDRGRGTQDAARARMVVCWLLHAVYGYNPPSIGRFMGRNHATVRAALKHVEELRRNSMYRQVIELIIKEVKNQKC